MIVIGHSLIEHENIHVVVEKQDFEHKAENSLFLFEWDEELIRHAKKNSLRFIVYITNEQEAILANSLGAEAVIVPLKIAKKVQELAEYYLFDTKVALLFESEDSLDEAIKNRVDMVIFEKAIK